MLNMVRRSRLELYFDVLQIIGSGVDKPTQIMYKSNSSWTVLHDILETLENGGFIKEEMRKNKLRYCITEKGENALSYHLKSLEGLVKDSLKLITENLYIQ